MSINELFRRYLAEQVTLDEFEDQLWRVLEVPSQQPITELLASLLRQLDRHLNRKRGPVDLSRIVEAVSGETGVSARDILGSSRKASIVRARHMVMHVANATTQASYSAIGRAIGNRDHSTVIAALRRVEQLMKSDPTVADLEQRVLARLGNQRCEGGLAGDEWTMSET